MAERAWKRYLDVLFVKRTNTIEFAELEEGISGEDGEGDDDTDVKFQLYVPLENFFFGTHPYGSAQYFPCSGKI
jgi:hypothetical protein